MPQLLALEWNSREIRVAVASGRERQVVIEHAFSVAWNPEGTELDRTQQRIGERIAAELDARGIGRPEALVAVGRTGIELRQLQLPPAPDAELPDMVRFQAAREFNEFDDRWLLDFVPIDETPDGPRMVLATAIAPAMIQQIEGVCQQAGLKMRRLLLRSCEAAALLTGDKSAPGQLRLLVDLLADEADLTAVMDGKAVFLRTTRFSGDPPPLPALLAEIRLTMAAVQNQLGGRKVESVVLCGQDGLHADLAQRIETELGLRAETFDPFSDVALGPALKDSPPAYPGRFAPLLGMLLVELRQAGHAIDFLHPRRRAEPPSKRKRLVLAATVVGVLGLAYLTYAQVDHYLLAAQVEELQDRAKDLDNKIGQKKKARDNVKEIKKWTDGEVNWLDQLYGLSQTYPSAEDAIVNEITVTVKTGDKMGSTRVDLKGAARSDQVVKKLEDRVRDAGGEIDAPAGKEERSSRAYPFKFETKLLLKEGQGNASKTESKKEAAAKRSADAPKSDPKKRAPSKEPVETPEEGPK